LFLDYLLGHPEICPVLRVIELLGEYTGADIAPLLETLSQINRVRAHTIDMVVSTEWAELPGASPELG